MKERPILFSGPMVRAILEGRKTQTRRIIKGIPERFEPDGNMGAISIKHPRRGKFGCLVRCRDFADVVPCPYGQPGDRLWVRETFGHNGCLNCPVHYRANEPDWKDNSLNPSARWYPSIHMPSWASRITLEITGVRVERLKDISESDAISEGGTWTDNGPRNWARLKGLTFEQANPVNGWNEGWSHIGETNKDRCLITAKTSFAHLWQSINGLGSWIKNPWVWVVEFTRVTE